MSFSNPKIGMSALPLHTIPIALLDTETTGLDTKSDRIIEIAAVRIIDGGIAADTFDELINPAMPVPPSSTEIHGITDTDVATARPFRDVISDFSAWVGSSIVMGYSLGFDLAILKAEHVRAGMAWKAPRSLCVRQLVKVLAPNLPGESLELTAEWLGIEVTDRHRALGDATLTARIYTALIPKLRAKGIETLAQAERACLQLGTRLHSEAQAGWHEVVDRKRPASVLEYARIDSYPYRHIVADVMHTPPLLIDASMPIKDALRALIEKRISSVFVRPNAPGGDVGILTERDILHALDARGVKVLTSPVSQFAKHPLVTIGKDEFIYRAMTRMTFGNFRHLGVTDATGDVVGALSVRDLLKQRAADAVSLGDTIDAAATSTELGRIWQGLTMVARGLVSEDVDPRNVAAVISRELRALTRRACELAEQRMIADGLGAPPVPYAMLVLGSGGRGESLLAMDQDNAVVYESGAADSDTDRWFEKLGTIVADTLNDTGVVFCKGGIMAKNAAWRMDVARWRDTVSRWIDNARPEDILNSDIFFDAAAVYGDTEMGETLHRHALQVAVDNKPFLQVMATKAADFPSAVGLFGRVRTEDGRIDLKKSGIMPIFSAARVVALENRIAARSTPGRLEAARDLGVRGAHLIGNLLEAHRILLGAILRQQLRDIIDGIPLSNKVAIADLDAHQKQELKWALQQSLSICDLLGTPARF